MSQRACTRDTKSWLESGQLACRLLINSGCSHGAQRLARPIYSWTVQCDKAGKQNELQGKQLQGKLLQHLLVLQGSTKEMERVAQVGLDQRLYL